jgi:hypothetical protein
MNCPKCNAILPDNAISCPFCRCRFGSLDRQYNPREEEVLPVNSYLLPIHVILLSLLVGILIIVFTAFTTPLMRIPFVFSLFLVFSVIPVLIALLRSVIELSILLIWRTQKNTDKGQALGAIIVGGLFILIGVFFLISAVLLLLRL